ALRDVRNPQPPREMLRGPLLEPTFTRNAVRETLQCQRPAPDVRNHRLGDRAVVLDDVTLGDTVVGIEQFLLVGDGDVVSRDRHGAHRCSLTTLPGALSVRTPV